MGGDKGEVTFWKNELLFWGDRLASHATKLSYQQFTEDPRHMDAFCWCISCIGESAARLLKADSGMDKSSDIAAALRKATSARNRYVHGYFDLETQIVWDTATSAVPSLMAALRKHSPVGQAQDDA